MSPGAVLATACTAGTVLGVLVGYLLARWAWQAASGETNRRPR